MDLFNWYFQDGLLCGDLCLIEMRKTEYRLEKNTYKEPKFIQKQDKKYKKTHPCQYRFHTFVKMEILSVKNSIATVILDKHQKIIVLQNMDSYFFLNEIRKKKIEEQLKLWVDKTT